MRRIPDTSQSSRPLCRFRSKAEIAYLGCGVLGLVQQPDASRILCSSDEFDGIFLATFNLVILNTILLTRIARLVVSFMLTRTSKHVVMQGLRLG